MVSSIPIEPGRDAIGTNFSRVWLLHQFVTNKVFYFFDNMMGLLKYNFLISEIFSVLVGLYGVNRGNPFLVPIASLPRGGEPANFLPDPA